MCALGKGKLLPTNAHIKVFLGRAPCVYIMYVHKTNTAHCMSLSGFATCVLYAFKYTLCTQYRYCCGREKALDATFSRIDYQRKKCLVHEGNPVKIRSGPAAVTCPYYMETFSNMPLRVLLGRLKK